METNKIVFLCLILLLVLVVSNYVSIEGFKSKMTKQEKEKKEKKKIKKQKRKEARSATTKEKLARTKKGLIKVGDKIKNASKSIAKGISNPGKLIKDVSTLSKNMKKTVSDVKNIKKTISDVKKTAADVKKTVTDVKKMETLVKNAEDKIIKNDELNKKILEKASSFDVNSQKVVTAAAKIDTTLSDVTNISNATQKNATSILTQMSEKSASVNKSVDDNKTIQKEINAKVDGVDAKMEIIKNNVDSAVQIKKEVDNTMNEFKVNSETMMKTIQLAIDKFDAAKLSASKQGFQNMDPVANASQALKKDMEMAKSLSFTTIDSAYDGNLKLEGFGDSTETHSLYKTGNIFELEKDVIEALNEFYKAYYAYQTCLHNKRKALDTNKTATTPVTVPTCGTAPSTNPTVARSGDLGAVYTAKETLITKINALNTAINNMKNTQTLSTTNADGSYSIAGKKVTETQFRDRHTEIKSLSERINATRSDLDMKMATLLDKSKGPLPEAQNKHNFENYATIGWSVLATSILYYTFVEMK